MSWHSKHPIITTNEINQEPEHPQLILVYSSTNDLTATTQINDFISDISVLITQASTIFPKYKINYSTLLPRTDTPLQTPSKINMKLIDGLSPQPNVHLVTHENIFSKGAISIDLEGFKIVSKSNLKNRKCGRS